MYINWALHALKGSNSYKNIEKHVILESNIKCANSLFGICVFLSFKWKLVDISTVGLSCPNDVKQHPFKKY